MFNDNRPLLPKMQISSKVANIPEALSIYINQLVYSLKRNGIDIITLSLGEAFFKIPMFDFAQINFEKGNHYSESRGIPELRKKIADYYDKQYDAKININEELLITVGSKPAIFMAFQAVLNDGDEALIHEPAWLSYQEQVKLTGAIPKFIPYDVRVDDFYKYYTEKTRILVLNNPNNPAGRVYTEDELRLVYKQCRALGIYVLIDEAYSDFLLDEKFHSMASIVPNKDGIIVVNSLSKNLGISGWRVGYVISNAEVIYNILKLNQHLITCASTVLLLYLAKYFDELYEITLPQAKEVVKKRKRIEEYMSSINIKLLRGSATFYFFISIEKYSHSSLDFALYLLFKYGIAVVPGSAYGESTERFLRISVGAEPEERITQAMQIIKDILVNDEYDGELVDNELKRLGFKKFSK